MAAYLKRDCPHCLSKSAGFEVVFQWYPEGRLDNSSMLGLCGVCDNGVVLRVKNKTFGSVSNYVQSRTSFPHENDYISEQYPSVLLSIPKDCPESVIKFYIQGMENLKSENWDAAGAMFRKSLDVATKILAPEHKNKNLFSRINVLVDCGRLTREMGDWSHELRIDGNEAVHDEEPETEEDAEAMQKFAEAFLRYAFTLPNLVARNRNKREGEIA